METIKLKTVRDGRGRLTVAEKLPFVIRRIYYLHECLAPRGGHAQRTVDRLITAAAGSFLLRWRTVQGWDGMTLSDPTEALRVPPLTWLELSEFSKDAVCLVIASEEYEEADSIRDYAQFLREARAA